MKKKIVISLVLFLILVYGAFAQNNWISFEIKGTGAGLRYERVINPYFTIGGYFSYTYITIPIFDYQLNSFEFGATARWYPFGKRFFIDLSLGYNIFEYEEEVERYIYNGYYGYYQYGRENRSGSGFTVAPGLGWTVDVGRRGRFFLSPGVKFPITFGSQFNFTVAPYLGLGGAF
jgi:hypothetical protein